MIQVQNLAIRLGKFQLRNIQFEIPTGSYAVLMGKTGCGKTSIMEAICGLRSLQEGSIHLMQRDVTRLKPAQRGVGFVPQDRALFSTMTVRDNLSFSLMLRKWNPSSIDQRVNQLAELLGLNHLLNRKPAGLSGGEAQRVALGRALAARPAILCLDEPLSALDDETRDEMHALLQSVREHTEVTTLHVTHHLSDAERLADRILLLKNGAVQNVSLEDLRLSRPLPAHQHPPEPQPRTD